MDLPEGRELNEEVIKNSKKLLRSKNGIGGAPTNYRRRRRRRADQQKSAAAPTNCRRRRRGAAGARLYFHVILSGWDSNCSIHEVKCRAGTYRQNNCWRLDFGVSVDFGFQGLSLCVLGVYNRGGFISEV